MTQAIPRRKRAAVHPQGVADQINRLALELNGVQLADADGVPAQIQKLVLNSLDSWMSRNAASPSASRYPLDVRVRMQLESYFSKLHYPIFGTPATFVRPWNGSRLIGAGYTFGWSDFDRVNCLALYEIQNSKTRRVALTNFVPGPDLHFAFLPTSASGAFRFMVYGNQPGESHLRMTAVLYSFDGHSLRNLWERRDLYSGRIHVTPQTVTLRYLDKNEYIQAVERHQLPPGHEAIYKITPQGLALQTEREIPFKSVS
ncbi:MAG: hypothetical protein ACRD2B_13105 [Terriglobia bacterium]